MTRERLLPLLLPPLLSPLLPLPLGALTLTPLLLFLPLI